MRPMADPLQRLPEAERLTQLAKLRRQPTEALVQGAQAMLTELTQGRPNDTHRAFLLLIEQVLAERQNEAVTPRQVTASSSSEEVSDVTTIGSAPPG
jgi:hypothetical protein